MSAPQAWHHSSIIVGDNGVSSRQLTAWHGFTSVVLPFFPPVSVPHSAWWPGPVLLCSKCLDIGFVQRPPPAVPAVCWWRWSGGVFWRGRGKTFSACPSWPPQGGHLRTPSSAIPLCLFSAGGEVMWCFAWMLLLCRLQLLFPHFLKTTQPKMSGDCEGEFQQWRREKRGITSTWWLPLLSGNPRATEI